MDPVQFQELMTGLSNIFIVTKIIVVGIFICVIIRLMKD